MYLKSLKALDSILESKIYATFFFPGKAIQLNSFRLNKHALSCYYMPGILFSPVDVERLLWVGNHICVFPIIL